MMKAGIDGRDRQLTIEAAKLEWTSYAKDLDRALGEIRRKHRK
jgi:hypothetical protein